VGDNPEVRSDWRLLLGLDHLDHYELASVSLIARRQVSG
jgi:hypothetical protein